MKKTQQSLLKYWGYNSFLPHQKEAMSCLNAWQDCLLVLPTGGSKSLCYQAPAEAMDGMAVVVSPLISLMKDQVDALVECGVKAMRLDSSMSQLKLIFDNLKGQIDYNKIRITLSILRSL